MTFRKWLGIRATVGGWLIGLIGGTAQHFTGAELAITLALIGCIVPLGVAWITVGKKRETEKIEQLERENARLRRQLARRQER